MYVLTARNIKIHSENHETNLLLGLLFYEMEVVVCFTVVQCGCAYYNKVPRCLPVIHVHCQRRTYKYKHICTVYTLV